MKVLRRAIALLAGLCFGLLAVEGAFRLRDHGAFPHLNVYRSDAKLGVRLRPAAREKISFSDNPVSSVRINAQGYRGADWPAHEDGEILVVGDSQAFGLGVDEADAFAWKLGALLHRPVADAAVPTYGPGEYDDVLAEELPRRRPKTVVYTVNLANDLFESVHPNVTRHAVWDGWAVRRENAPRGVRHFPGRRLLFNESHAFFALRGLWWKWTGPADEGAVPSEGGWQDLLGAEHATLAQRDAGARLAAQAKRQELERIDEGLAKISGARFTPDLLIAAGANPGDIVLRNYGEEASPVPLTATEIARAAELRHAYEDQLHARHDDATLARLAERDRLATQLRSWNSDGGMTPRTPLYAHLARAKQLCDEYGAELVVLVLPLDVQVSDAEWAKYGAARKVDLSSSRILALDVIRTADELGARSVDAWPVLAAAEPGAFLEGDLHMSPKGHAHVAEALARVLRRPLRAAVPPPEGRSAVPTPAEWERAPRGIFGITRRDESDDLVKHGCVGREVREWMRIDCSDGAFEFLESGPDVLVFNHDGGGSLIAPEVQGSPNFDVRFAGPKTDLYIYYLWALNSGSDFGVSAMPHDAGKLPLPMSAAETTMCRCERQLSGAAQCSDLYGSADAGCLRAYAGDCDRLLACARADRRAPPTCAAGETLTPATLRCVVPGRRR